MATLYDLDGIMSSLPGYDVLTTDMKQRALDGALIPDDAGVWPGGAGYVDTHDVYYAAASLIGFLQAQPTVRQTSSEGTSVTVQPMDWGALAQWYRSMSPICQAQGGAVLVQVPIPGPTHVVRTDMTGRCDEYGDVDTDSA